MPAIIYTTHAGPELGNAFADVISGKYSPAGRLAQTWYKSEYELAPIECYDIIENDMTYSVASTFCPEPSRLLLLQPLP